MTGPAAMATLRWGASTHTGMVRGANEDSLLAEASVFAVADGMGGHLAGEVASDMAVSTLRRRLVEADAPTDVQSIVAAVRSANVEIHDAAGASADRRGMGTTLTALAVLRDRSGQDVLALVNVGDSRAYVLRDGMLSQLSVDHSYVQELISSGQLREDEARHHPHRNIVTRALGIDPFVAVDAWTLPIVRGDRFLLCSDGLVDEVVDADIAAVLADADEPQAAADRLVALANRNGGRDNTTVVVVDVLEGADPQADGIGLVPQGNTGARGGTITAEIPVVRADPFESDRVPAPMSTAELGEPSDITGPLRRPPTASAAALTATRVDDDDVNLGTPDHDREPGHRRRRLTFPMIIFVTAVLAVFVVAFTVTAAYARSGYFLAFEDDTVVVYKGRPGGLLWFDPTLEATTEVQRDDLPAARAALIATEPTFDSLDAAVSFAQERATTGQEPAATTTSTGASTTAPTTSPLVTTSAGAGAGGP